MPEHILHGCQSKPLASYLKSLGILRLVSEQCDSSARGSWQDGCFRLSCRLDEAALLRFFLAEYRPSPLVSPWNGGSGFYPGDNKEGIDAVAKSEDERLVVYRRAIASIFAWPEFQEIYALPAAKRKARGEEVKKNKEAILQRCRSQLPEECLPWLDAAYALREDKAFFPPLLGTGGNEGRLEFSNNFMQKVCELLLDTPEDRQGAWLRASLFDVPVPTLPKIKMGQFDPGNAGGINQGREFENIKVQNNPWDFILMFEGTLLFASALVRRSPGDISQASAPFSVTSLSAGFASSNLQDTGRGEVWMPLWSHPASVRELRRLLGEGRASLGRNQVREGLDFARAAAMLGVDRGIDGFERFSLLERRGQSYVALPSGTVSVGWKQPVALLDEVGEYLKTRPLVKPDRLPASFSSAHRRLTEAVFKCTEQPDAARFIEVSRCLAKLDCLPFLRSCLGPADCPQGGSKPAMTVVRKSALPPLSPRSVPMASSAPCGRIWPLSILSSLKHGSKTAHSSCLGAVKRLKGWSRSCRGASWMPSVWGLPLGGLTYVWIRQIFCLFLKGALTPRFLQNSSGLSRWYALPQGCPSSGLTL